MTSEAESKALDEIREAQAARNLLENEIFIGAWNDVFEGIKRAHWNTDVREEQYRDLLFKSLKGAEMFRNILERRIETGKMAERALRDLRKKKKEFLKREPDPYGAL